MKLEFSHRATLNGVEGNIKEYIYDFRFTGITNQGNNYTSSWNRYSSYARAANEAKKDIKDRLINQGAFDFALDGMCPYENNCI